MTKGQIDRIGERLREGTATEADFLDLTSFLAEFSAPLEMTVRTLQGRLTAARVKRVQSIIDKLKRPSTESLRLSRIQDIAGCRIVVEDTFAQEEQVETVSRLFGETKIYDRRAKPSHGYRAVHLVVISAGKPVEIQVRTIPQNLWAQFSERVAERIDPMLKYGTGPQWALAHLKEMSQRVIDLEAPELLLTEKLRACQPGTPEYDALLQELRDFRRAAQQQRQDLPWEFNRRFLQILMESRYDRSASGE